MNIWIDSHRLDSNIDLDVSEEHGQFFYYIGTSLELLDWDRDIAANAEPTLATVVCMQFS